MDKTGQTIDFLLTEQRDEKAAKRFLTKAIRRHGVPEKITIDGSEANAAAIRSYNQEHGTAIVIRQVKYSNNIVEQDHRAVKRVTRPMLGFKAFDAGPCTLVGIELMHMIRKGQLAGWNGRGPDAGPPVLLPGGIILIATELTYLKSVTHEKLRQSPSNRRCTQVVNGCSYLVVSRLELAAHFGYTTNSVKNSLRRMVLLLQSVYGTSVAPMA